LSISVFSDDIIPTVIAKRKTAYKKNQTNG